MDATQTKGKTMNAAKKEYWELDDKLTECQKALDGECNMTDIKFNGSHYSYLAALNAFYKDQAIVTRSTFRKLEKELRCAIKNNAYNKKKVAEMDPALRKALGY